MENNVNPVQNPKAGIIATSTGLLLLGGVIGYFVGNGNPVSFAPPSPTTSIDISDWQTYRHSLELYEIQYPQDWYRESPEGPVSDIETFVVTSYSPTATKDLPAVWNRGTLTISVAENPKNISGEMEWSEQQKTTQDPDESIRRENVQLAGQTAFRLNYKNYKPLDGLEHFSIRYLVPYQRKMYEISLNGVVKYQNTLENILSSLQFIYHPPITVLNQETAIELVKRTWGGCEPAGCRELLVELVQRKGTWYVIATFDGAYDDSTSASRYEAVASYQNGEWLLPPIQQATWSQTCQQGRGHQDFSQELCL